jgi:L-rhamnose mutarotase
MLWPPINGFRFDSFPRGEHFHLFRIRKRAEMLHCLFDAALGGMIDNQKRASHMEITEKRTHNPSSEASLAPRYAFNLRIKTECIEEYELEHKRVWPELLAKLKAVGISDYSIFRRGQDLTLVLRCADFDRAWDELDKDPVNQRWQVFMSRLFEPVPGHQAGERFAMCKEVFYLP